MRNILNLNKSHKHPNKIISKSDLCEDMNHLSNHQIQIIYKNH